jgi:hypothetical protein
MPPMTMTRIRAEETLRSEPAAPDRLGDVWPRIERWLAAHAPDLAASLRPGATADAIDALERDLAIALPPDVRAAWLVHDGQARGAPPLYESFRLLSLAEMAASPRSAMLAIARAAHGDLLCVDGAGRVLAMDPGARDRRVVADSLRYLLIAFLTDLDDGEMVRDARVGFVARETLRGGTG